MFSDLGAAESKGKRSSYFSIKTHRNVILMQTGLIVLAAKRPERATKVKEKSFDV